MTNTEDMKQTGRELTESSTEQGDGVRRVLNYMWLSAEKQYERAQPIQPESPMPDKYVANVSRIAQEYPDVEIYFWIDEDLMNSSQILFVSDIVATYPNMRLKSLNEIEEYRKSPIFQRGQEGHIWCRVDYSKVIIPEHILRTEEVDEVFFSDLDITDPQIGSEKTTSILEEYGVVLAESFITTTPQGDDFYVLENQFFGFCSKGQDFLSKSLLSKTKFVTENEMNGHVALCDCVNRCFNKADIVIRQHQLAGPNSMVFNDHQAKLNITL